MTLTNKEKVVQLLKGLETGDTSAYAYINPQKYVQRNYSAPFI